MSSASFTFGPSPLTSIPPSPANAVPPSPISLHRSGVNGGRLDFTTLDKSCNTSLRSSMTNNELGSEPVRATEVSQPQRNQMDMSNLLKEVFKVYSTVAADAEQLKRRCERKEKINQELISKTRELQKKCDLLLEERRILQDELNVTKVKSDKPCENCPVLEERLKLQASLYEQFHLMFEKFKIKQTIGSDDHHALRELLNSQQEFKRPERESSVRNKLNSEGKSTAGVSNAVTSADVPVTAMVVQNKFSPAMPLDKELIEESSTTDFVAKLIGVENTRSTVSAAEKNVVNVENAPSLRAKLVPDNCDVEAENILDQGKLPALVVATGLLNNSSAVVKSSITNVVTTTSRELATREMVGIRSDIKLTKQNIVLLPEPSVNRSPVTMSAEQVLSKNRTVHRTGQMTTLSTATREIMQSKELIVESDIIGVMKRSNRTGIELETELLQRDSNILCAKPCSVLNKQVEAESVLANDTVIAHDGVLEGNDEDDEKSEWLNDNLCGRNMQNISIPETLAVDMSDHAGASVNNEADTAASEPRSPVFDRFSGHKVSYGVSDSSKSLQSPAFCKGMTDVAVNSLIVSTAASDDPPTVKKLHSYTANQNLLSSFKTNLKPSNNRICMASPGSAFGLRGVTERGSIHIAKTDGPKSTTIRSSNQSTTVKQSNGKVTKTIPELFKFKGTASNIVSATGSKWGSPKCNKQDIYTDRRVTEILAPNTELNQTFHLVATQASPKERIPHNMDAIVIATQGSSFDDCSLQTFPNNLNGTLAAGLNISQYNASQQNNTHVQSSASPKTNSLCETKQISRIIEGNMQDGREQEEQPRKHRVLQFKSQLRSPGEYHATDLLPKHTSNEFELFVDDCDVQHVHKKLRVDQSLDVSDASPSIFDKHNVERIGAAGKETGYATVSVPNKLFIDHEEFRDGLLIDKQLDTDAKNNYFGGTCIKQQKATDEIDDSRVKKDEFYEKDVFPQCDDKVSKRSLSPSLLGENSFNRIPLRETNKPGYVYKDFVRKKRSREQLEAFACVQCQQWYQGRELSEDEITSLMKSCRHKAMQAPPPTPDHYWSVGFMDTQKCKERGYLNTEAANPSKYRRKRRLCMRSDKTGDDNDESGTSREAPRS